MGKKETRLFKNYSLVKEIIFFHLKTIFTRKNNTHDIGFVFSTVV